MNIRTVISVALAASSLSAMPSLCHAADEALVVGVDQYPGLRPGSNLGGCVNDAQIISEKLKLYGFHVTVLSNEKASKADILGALAKLQTSVGPNDRFAFYFAGHGTVASNGESVLLTNSSLDADESGDIQTDELYQSVRKLPAKAKTILLDSCHSGGMVRSVGGLRGDGKSRPRVYVRTKMLDSATRDGQKSWQRVKVNGADDITDTTKGGGVCYFTAALKTQVANETEIEGVRHGVFTFSLAKKLTGGKDLWGDISAGVSSDVMDASDGEQKPVLGPGSFLQTAVFDGGGDPNPAPPPTPVPGPGPAPTPAPPAPTKDTTLDKLFNLSNPDPTRIKLTMTPELSPVKVGQTVKFVITAGIDGYLVLVNRDPEGKLEALYPQQGQKAEAARVRSGQIIQVPGADDEAMTPDAAGTDGLKAILFTNPEAAQAMLTALGGDAVDINSANKSWKKVKVAASPFYTSELISQIVGR